MAGQNVLVLVAGNGIRLGMGETGLYCMVFLLLLPMGGLGEEAVLVR